MSTTTTKAHRVSVRHTEDSSTWSCKCGAGHTFTADKCGALHRKQAIDWANGHRADVKAGTVPCVEGCGRPSKLGGVMCQPCIDAAIAKPVRLPLLSALMSDLG